MSKSREWQAGDRPSSRDRHYRSSTGEDSGRIEGSVCRDANRFQANYRNTEVFIASCIDIGLQYGPAFQTVKDLWVSDDRQRTLARIALNEDQLAHAEKYKIHPALLDGCFQTLMAMIDTSSATYLPTAIEEIRLYVKTLPNEIWCHGELQQLNDRFVECHLTIYDHEGNIVANVRRLRANAAPHKERVDQWGEVVKLQLLKYVWNESERLPEPKGLETG